MPTTTESIYCVGIDNRLQIFDADAASFSLRYSHDVTLPSNVQYAWQSADNRHFYVATSNGLPRITGNKHELTVFRVDPAKRTLVQIGESFSLKQRPVHISMDAANRHLLVAYHEPAGVSVHPIRADGSIDVALPQMPGLDFGIYAHQIMNSPDGKLLIVVARGNDATSDKKEDPGALKVFNYDRGVLTPNASIAPNGGFGFGPRDVAFHRTKPWIFVSLERQNKLCVFAIENGTVRPDPIIVVPTTEHPLKAGVRQVVGPVQLHPNGEVAYVSNRGGPYNWQDLHNGGESTVSVFRIDQDTGKVHAVQHADTRGNRPRTFSIDPTQRMLVAANMQPRTFEEDGMRKILPSSLAAFEIGRDGMLEFRTKHDVDVGGSTIFWSGYVRLGGI